MSGPLETERDAIDAARHILDSPPGTGAWQAGSHRLLEDTCRAAGVDLGAYDEGVLVELAGALEPQKCAALAGIIGRAHEALPRSQRDRPRYAPAGPGVAMPGGGWISGPSIGGPS